MSKRVKHYLSAASFMFVFLLTGCTISNTNDIKSAVDKLDSGVKIASDVFEAERKSRPRIRRIEAIEYYVQTRYFNPTETATTPDFVVNDKVGSFARFVCAGSGSMLREHNATEYYKQYSKNIKDIIDPGSDSLMSQYDRFKKLNKQVEITRIPNQPPQNAVQNCAKEVNNLLANWKPVPTTDTYDENPAEAVSLAVEAAKKAYELAVLLAQKYNENQAKEKFSEYVINSHENFSTVMEKYLPAGVLENSWNHRKAVSLQQPLITFKKIFDVEKLEKGVSNREENDNKIREIGLAASKQLDEFDSIKDLPSPAYVREKIIDSEDKLMKMAKNEDISIGEIISFLSSTADEFTQIKSKYDSLNDSISKLAKVL